MSIYQRGKKGTYCADFWFDGHHRRRSLETTNKKVAMQRAIELENELAAGSFRRQPPKVTIDDAIEQYLEYLSTENRAQRTLSRYKGELKQFAGVMGEQNVLLLASVTTTRFDRYRALRKKSIGDSTLYHEGVVIKQFFKWALSRGLILQNPLAACKLTKPVRPRRTAPTLAQISAILGQATARLATLVLLLACTGMRSGELQGLRREDVDLSAGFLHVCRQIGGQTKTKTERTIPIHQRIQGSLKKLIAANEHKLLVTSLPSRKYPAGGRPINTKRLNDNFKASAARGGIVGFTIHSLRRFFNTTCVNAGFPERVVRLWMGHHDRSMTGVYYDLSDEESLRFMAKVPFGQLPAA